MITVCTSTCVLILYSTCKQQMMDTGVQYISVLCPWPLPLDLCLMMADCTCAFRVHVLQLLLLSRVWNLPFCDLLKTRDNDTTLFVSFCCTNRNDIKKKKICMHVHLLHWWKSILSSKNKIFSVKKFNWLLIGCFQRYEDLPVDPWVTRGEYLCKYVV